jgi:hypothetical protein
MVPRCSHKAAEIQTQNTKLFRPEGKTFGHVCHLHFVFFSRENEPFESIRDDVLKSSVPLRFIIPSAPAGCLALWRWIISSFTCHLKDIEQLTNLAPNFEIISTFWLHFETE